MHSAGEYSLRVIFFCCEPCQTLVIGFAIFERVGIHFVCTVLQVIAKGETDWPWRSMSLLSDPLRQHAHRECSFARVGDRQASCQRVTFRSDGGPGSNWPAHQWILWRVRSHAAQTTPHTMYRYLERLSPIDPHLTLPPHIINASSHPTL